MAQIVKLIRPTAAAAQTAAATTAVPEENRGAVGAGDAGAGAADESAPAESARPGCRWRRGLRDGFGLAARKGGRELVGYGHGSAFGWYTTMLKDSILDIPLRRRSAYDAATTRSTVQVCRSSKAARSACSTSRRQHRQSRAIDAAIETARCSGWATSGEAPTASKMPATGDRCELVSRG